MTSLSEKLAALRANKSPAPTTGVQNAIPSLPIQQSANPTGQLHNLHGNNESPVQASTAGKEGPISPKEPPKVNSNNGHILVDKINELQAALLDRHPRMPTLLREIHTTLREYPENVTLLSEEEICVVVNGLMIQTGTEFASSITKGKGAAGLKAKINQLGLDAF